MRDATVVSPFALLLFGGVVALSVENMLKGEVVLDSWLRFAIPGQHAVIINAMRTKLMVRAWALYVRGQWRG